MKWKISKTGNIMLAIAGFAISFLISAVLPIQNAESVEMKQINNEVALYKERINSKYVELDSPEYVAILNAGKKTFLSEMEKQTRFIVPAVAFACLLFGIFLEGITGTTIAAIMLPTFVGVMFEGLHIALWAFCVAIAFSGNSIRKKLWGSTIDR